MLHLLLNPFLTLNTYNYYNAFTNAFIGSKVTIETLIITKRTKMARENVPFNKPGSLKTHCNLS